MDSRSTASERTPQWRGPAFPKSLHRELKLHCVHTDTSVIDFVVAALEEKLGRKPKPKKGSE